MFGIEKLRDKIASLQARIEMSNRIKLELAAENGFLRAKLGMVEEKLEKAAPAKEIEKGIANFERVWAKRWGRMIDS